VKTLRSNSARNARIGFAFLAAVVLVAAVPGEAAAKHWRHVARHHGTHKHLQDAQASVLPETTHLGSMRYYGGPKSPVWRAPVEN
jgi:hypothetical protein